jgi:D-3-phosphoglycerate dehydrogenase
MSVVRFDTWIDPAFDTVLKGAGIGVRVARRSSPKETFEILKTTRVLHVSAAKDELTKDWLVTEALLAHLPHVALVSSQGAGYDTIDVPACTRAGIPVVNQAGGNAVSVAEHTLGLILSLLHRFGENERLLRSDRRGVSREALMGREAAGRMLGLVGIGHVGSRVAALARAFGMQVVAFDPLLPHEEIQRKNATACGSLNELLERSDIVSLHGPRDKTTLGMMNAAAFARMKKGALFISTSRGGIHDEAALAAALASGHLGGAGLDVWDQEPPPPGHPLLAFDNVVATYHTAGVTHECRRNIATIAAEQIAGFLRGEKPPRLVNPEVWERRRKLT